MILWLCLLQAKPEIELKWGLPRDKAADYALSEIKGGKPVPLKDRGFLIFGGELLEDGGSTLVVSAYEDVGPYFMFQLPKGKIKAGARWPLEITLFKDARFVLTPAHCLKETVFSGQGLFKKVEKIKDRDCALIEGVFQYFEVKYDAQGKRTVARQPSGTLRTAQWLSLENTELLRGSWELQGKSQEYKGVKQGEEPRNTKIDLAQALELRASGLVLDAKEQFQPIADAIKKGVAALRKLQERNGSFVDRSGSFARDFPVGSTALSLMALLHSGVKADDPAVKAGLAYVQAQPLKMTYDVASTLMLLETKYLPLEQLQDIEELTEEKAKEAIRKGITAEDKALAERCLQWLLKNQTRAGTWGYPDNAEFNDHSNTQYALLGLKSAARMGLTIPDEVWKKVVNHWLATQRSGGKKAALKIEGFDGQALNLGSVGTDETFTPGPWGYFVANLEGMPDTDQGYGAMTCAGLTSLVIAESELTARNALDAGLRDRVDLAKKRALVWLQENYSVRGAPPSAGFWSMFHLYYLYSLERVGVLCGIRRIGGHDWYLEGAALLCRAQRSDGLWISYDEIPPIDTAFALLFLKKATLRVSTGR
jgi:hypothetical protein